MGCDGYAVLKSLELVTCIVCMVYKRVSDWEAFQIFFLRQKFSDEWPLLNTVTWDKNGSIFADITYGAFVIVTAALLVAYLAGELHTSRVYETFLLILGALMFLAAGSLELAALDMVPQHLVKNAAALGVLSLFGGLLFILDLLLGRRRRKRYDKEAPAIKAKDHRAQNGHANKNGVLQNADNPADEKAMLKALEAADAEKGDTSSLKKSPPGLQKGPENHEAVVGQLRASLKEKPKDEPDGKVEDTLLRSSAPPMSDINGTKKDSDTNNVANGGRGHLLKSSLKRSTPQDTHHDTWRPDAREDDADHLQSQKVSSSTPLGRNGRSLRYPGRQAPDDPESDNDSLHIPSVSFLLAERDKGSAGSKLLPMLPLGDRGGPSDRPYMTRMSSGDHHEEGGRSRYNSGATSPEGSVFTDTSGRPRYYYSESQSERAPSRAASMEDLERDYFRSSQHGPGPEDRDFVEIERMYRVQRYAGSKQQSVDYPPQRQSQHRRNWSSGDRDRSYEDPTERRFGTRDESPHSKRYQPDAPPTSPGPMERHRENVSKGQKSVLASSRSLDWSRADEPEELSRRWRMSGDLPRKSLGSSSSRDREEPRAGTPASPRDPGYVLHTAHNWPEVSPKTPSSSPSERAERVQTPVSSPTDRIVASASQPSGKFRGAGASSSAGASAGAGTKQPMPSGSGVMDSGSGYGVPNKVRSPTPQSSSSSPTPYRGSESQV